MKILHINSYYSNRKFYKHLYDLQIQTGHEVDVVVPVPENYQASDFDHGSYTDFRYNHGPNDRIIFHLKHHKIIRDLLPIYGPKNYDIAHAHSLFSNGYVAYKLKEAYGTPYVVAVRTTDTETFFKKMVHLRSLGVEILKEAAAVIFLSPAYREMTLEKYVPQNLKEDIRAKSYIIPNGIDPYWLEHKGQVKTKPLDKALNLLQIGEVSRTKNIKTTIKVAEELAKRGYKIELDVYGKVVHKSQKEAIDGSPLVTYHGIQPKEVIRQAMDEADIFVLNSLKETFGLVYAEAMSQGLPVIYTEGQGFDQQFPEGTVGYHAPARDVQAIADQIEKVLENYETISANAIEKVDCFDWRRITHEYNNVYNQIIK